MNPYDDISPFEPESHDHLSPLTDEQRTAHDTLFDFLCAFEPGSEILFNACGGSGKSFTIRSLIESLVISNRPAPRLVTLAGRATLHLTNEFATATTIHKLMYYPIIDKETGNLLKWEKKDKEEVYAECEGGLIVDEASMVSEDIQNDLMAIGVPIVWVLDDNQLEPVDPETKEPFCVSHKQGIEKLSLTKNMRVMDGKENLLKLNVHLRQPDASMSRRFAGKGVKFVNRSSIMKKKFHEDNQYDVIGCGTHKVRKAINRLVRQARGFYTDHAQVGEEIRCLKNTIVGGIDIYNGERYRVLEVGKPSYGLREYTIQSIDFDDKIVTVRTVDQTWEDEKVDHRIKNIVPFAFGYCCTIHSLQGSTVDKFLFIHENVSFFIDQRRFAYTGVSRAREELHVAV